MVGSARKAGRRLRIAGTLVGLVDRSGDTVTLRLIGELVGGMAPVVRTAWTEAFSGKRGNPPASRIVLDLSGIRRWDLLGLAAVIDTGAQSDRVVVQGARPKLARALAEALDGWEVQAPVRVLRTDRPSILANAREGVCQGIDSLLALVGLVLLAPLLLLVALAIVLDSPGPIFFTQERSGRLDREGRVRVIRVCKFRTMIADAEAQRARLRAANLYGDGAFFKIVEDPRITRVGRFLRAWSLDELPQLLNVIRGDMRLVGNRPLPLDEASALREPWQRVRFKAPAGVTGLWQVSGRSEVDASARMAMDTAYAVARSTVSDLAILARTVPVLLGRGGR